MPEHAELPADQQGGIHSQFMSGRLRCASPDLRFSASSRALMLGIKQGLTQLLSTPFPQRSPRNSGSPGIPCQIPPPLCPIPTPGEENSQHSSIIKQHLLGALIKSPGRNFQNPPGKNNTAQLQN